MLARFADTRARTLPILLTVLFALFIVLLPRYSDVGKASFVFLILTGFFFLVFNLRELKTTTTTERLLFIVIAVNFLWIAFTFYVNGEPGQGKNFLWTRHFYFLFAIPLFFLFRKHEISDRIIILSLFASIAFTLGDMLIDLGQGIDHRLQGVNPNALGPIQICLSGILLFFFMRKPNTPLRWLALGGFVLGIATIILSQSRNTWVTLGILSIFFILYLAHAQPLWKRIGLGICITLLLASAYSIPMVKTRVDLTLESISNYSASQDYRDIARTSSLGVRIELWKTAWNIFLENPLLGVGIGGFKEEAIKNSERYQVNEAVRQYKYAHNQYLVTLATRGIPGLILLLLVLLIPIYMAMSQQAFEYESKSAQLSVMLLCMIYLVGCLAEDHFETKSFTMFFGVMLPFLLARISLKKFPESHDPSL